MKDKPKIGDTINYLTILDLKTEQLGQQNYTIAYCKCKCGNLHKTRLTLINKNQAKSCGCYRKEQHFIKHNLSRHKLYFTYHNMIDRCYNQQNQAYKDYGNRGIKICQEWLDDFMNFYNWAISNGWKKKLTIERKNVNGDYSPDNCEWIVKSKQSKNRRNTVRIIAFGEEKILTDWTKDPRCEIDIKTFSQRINNGENPEIAMKSRRNHENH